MNSRNGLVFLLLCLATWTLCAEAVTSVLGSAIRRRTAPKLTTRRPPTVPTVPNAITQMLINNVQPATKHMNDIMDIINPQGNGRRRRAIRLLWRKIKL
ncbi:Hypothetical predicted protein [Paramuricea clavata]|uniref:Uncharacterized protein n=1 Tax=Paramuricea clavata TaxID=317549 RepID=A0A7D9DIR8_PARCT|nr:Hypothetical predicted protein [Paramuricea clavata]